jgi:hypothetical protein
LDQHGSIGEKSGEYGGSGISSAPAARTASATPVALCGERLSHTTTSPS